MNWLLIGIALGMVVGVVALIKFFGIFNLLVAGFIGFSLFALGVFGLAVAKND